MYIDMVRGTYRYYRNIYMGSQLSEKELERTRYRYRDRYEKSGDTTGIGVLITSHI